MCAKHANMCVSSRPVDTLYLHKGHTIRCVAVSDSRVHSELSTALDKIKAISHLDLFYISAHHITKQYVFSFLQSSSVCLYFVNFVVLFFSFC